MTIEETISGYFSEKEALSLFSDTTIFNRKYELKRFLNFCKAHRVESPSEIKKKTIIAYLTHIKASKHSTKNVLYCLSSYLDFLVGKNIVEENIARFIDRPKFKHPEADYLEFNEVQTLFKCVAEKTTGKSVDRNILLLNLFFTLCLRASEAVNLRLNDVKLDSRILWVKQKGSKVVKLPINDDITEQFLNWYEVRKEYNGSNTDFVFISSHGNKLTTRQAGNIVSNSMKLAGIKKNKNGPHILRHSGATFRLKRGENIRIIQKLLGHGSLSTTEKYLHFNETDLRDMIERSPIVISDLKV